MFCRATLERLLIECLSRGHTSENLYISDAHRATVVGRRHGLDRRGRDGVPVDARPLSLPELLDLVPSWLPVQLEVKAHADPDLARRTALALCERCRADRYRIEVISFHISACEAGAAAGLHSRLVLFADYRLDALADWVRGRGIAGRPRRALPADGGAGEHVAPNGVR